MNPTVLILGNGKMARNAGLFLLRKGFEVTWICRNADPTYLPISRLRQAIRRVSGHSSEQGVIIEYDEKRIKSADIIIECVKEELNVKQKVLSCLEYAISPNTLLLSSSSSILPSKIHEQCFGLHFFYPLELTSFAELIVPEGCSESHRLRIYHFAKMAGLNLLEQGSGNAFTVNRLMLALQSECFRALRSEYQPITVERASSSRLIPSGQLSMMDSVGLDTIALSVSNYLNIMSPENIRSYILLKESLEILISENRLGNKNRRGLLCGDDLPWPASEHTECDIHQLQKRLFALLINSCYRFIETGQIQRNDLNWALQTVFGADCSIEEAVEYVGRKRIFTILSEFSQNKDLSYYFPANALKC